MDLDRIRLFTVLQTRAGNQMKRHISKPLKNYPLYYLAVPNVRATSGFLSVTSGRLGTLHFPAAHFTQGKLHFVNASRVTNSVRIFSTRSGSFLETYRYLQAAIIKTVDFGVITEVFICTI